MMKPFKWKSFTSFVLTISFLAVALSGIGLYLAPKGRIANWIHWTWLGIDKDGWADLHQVFVVLFLAAALFHLFYFNWKVFWSYFRSRTRTGIRYGKELAAAIALFLAFWFGAVWELPPVYSVVMLADSIDRSYEQKENEPPLPHAEDLSIEDYAAKVAGVSPGKLAGMLQDKGYQVSDYGETIKAVAERHSVSPGEMLKVLAAGGDDSETQTRPDTVPAGWGVKTLAEVCRETGITLEKGMAVLREAGIAAGDGRETIKEIAARAGRSPGDVVDLLFSSE